MRDRAGMLVVLMVASCSDVPDTEPGDSAADSAVELLRTGTAAGVPRAPHAVRGALSRGATRLADLQADTLGDNARNGLDDPDPDDGGWDFELPPAATAHTPESSPENLYGASALGVLSAVRAAPATPRFLTALLEAGAGVQRRSGADSPADFVYLSLLSEVADNPGFAELSRLRYDAKRASSGGAFALGESIRDLRHASGNDGLIAYDLVWLALGADALHQLYPAADYARDAATYISIVTQDLASSPPRFDVRDATERYYYQGLAWSLVALARGSARRDLFAEVRELLVAAQLPNGAWPWSAQYAAANTQATAHAVQALSLISVPRAHGVSARSRGAAWLVNEQQPNGGWLANSTTESPLLNGEALLAIQLASARSRAPLEPMRPAEAVGSAAAPLLEATADLGDPPLAQPLAL